MTNCTCTVTDCTHNSDRCCCKSEILVDVSSKDACSCGCTCCASFDKRGHDTFQNNSKMADPSLTIGCNAIQCIYNEGNRCQAKSVSINGMNGTSSNHTECATFKAR